MAGAKWATAVERELRESGHASVMLENNGLRVLRPRHGSTGPAVRHPGQSPRRHATALVRACKAGSAGGRRHRAALRLCQQRPTGRHAASAARTYCNEFGVAVGRRVLVLANNDSAYEAALDLKRAGIDIVGVVDQREAVSASLSETLASLRIPHHRGSTIKKATGRHRVRCAVIVDQSGLRQTVRCDTILVSGGWTPSVHLHSQSGGKVGYDADLSNIRSHEHQAAQPVDRGVRGSSAAVGMPGGRRVHLRADGWRSARARASGHAPKAEKLVIPPPLLGYRAGKRFIDIQDDVTVEDIELAARENFRSVEHLKRYTTLGMGTDQGKTSNVNGLTIMGALRSESPGAVGTTTFRPPYTRSGWGCCPAGISTSISVRFA